MSKIPLQGNGLAAIPKITKDKTDHKRNVWRIHSIFLDEGRKRIQFCWSQTGWRLKMSELAKNLSQEGRGAFRLSYPATPWTPSRSDFRPFHSPSQDRSPCTRACGIVLPRRSSTKGSLGACTKDERTPCWGDPHFCPEFLWKRFRKENTANQPRYHHFRLSCHYFLNTVTIWIPD